MSRKKIFISFDFDKDKVLRDLLIGQSKNKEYPFTVIDTSLHEAAPEKEWKKKATARIRKADLVIVMLGEKTYRAPGVLKEVRIARNLGKKTIQLIGHKDGKYARVPDAGILYRWTWDNLKKLLC
jgi:predicted GTPase